MILVNGKPDEFLPVRDRGLSYGDGLFETIAIKDQKPLLWNLHWRRLEASCEQLKINCPTESLLKEDIQQLLIQADDGYRHRSVIKIIVTRGTGERGYQYDPTMSSTRIAMLSDWPTHQGTETDKGIKARLCDTRLSEQPLLAGIKHLNRLEQVMARSEWSENDIAEGIMLDNDNNIIEGIMSNIFFVDDQQCLVTPSLTRCGVAGVQREYVLDIAEHNGFQTNITDVPAEQLVEYKEAFVTNSLIGIWPLIAIDNQHYTIGPVTLSLQAFIK